MILKSIAKKYVDNKTTLIYNDTDNWTLLEYVLGRDLKDSMKQCKLYGNGEVRRNPSIINLSEIV